jgi:site-specific recombinase XerD
LRDFDRERPKTRTVPIMRQTTALLASYLEEQGIGSAEMLGHPLFFNCWRKKLTRQGINYIISKYSSELTTNTKISAHTFRNPS